MPMALDAQLNNNEADRDRLRREREAARNVADFVRTIDSRYADALEIRVVKGRRSLVLTRKEAVDLIGELAECVVCAARWGTAEIEIGE